MSKVTTAIKLIRKPKELVRPLVANGFLKCLSDKAFYTIVYEVSMGKKLNLEEPRLYNEKLQWLKLYYRRPDLTNIVDKYKVREYVAGKIGDSYLVPLLGKWDTVEEIDINKLPQQFVLKCNHDQGSVVICKDKSTFHWDKAKEKLKRKLHTNHYWRIREWPYKGITPCIIGEKYLESDTGNEDLTDYKVLCFNGEPKLIEVHYGRFKGTHTQDFYDADWNKTEITQYGTPMSDVIMEKPSFKEEMLQLSKMLSRDFPHIRVDWYFTNGKLYFSELTLYDASGFDPFDADEEELLGQWLTLPEKYNN